MMRKGWALGFSIFIITAFLQVSEAALTSYGPTAVSKPVGHKAWSEYSQIKFLQWNVENHFPNKSARQLKAVANLVLAVDPDLLLTQEVDTQSTMEAFQKKSLNDQYRAVLIDGNDARGIDSGLYIKKDFPLVVEAQSFKDLKDKEGEVFRRDAITFLFKQDAASAPSFAVIGVHLKSMRDVAGDPKGLKQRTREVAGLKFVHGVLKKEFGADFPIIISGDFNNDVATAKEFDQLRKQGYKDALELVGYKFARYTHFYFEARGGRQTKSFLQLDGTQFDPAAQKLGLVLDADVLPQLDDQGKVLADPANISEKQNPGRPSDHKATIVILDSTKI